MLFIDYLVLNRDRHGANIEVLRDLKAKTVRLAPLFDHGLSLVCRCHSIDELDAFDVLEDRKVQAFVGTSSTFENVNLKGGVKVNNIAYGTTVGGDTNMFDMKYGFKGVISTFFGYNKRNYEKL